MKGAKNEPPRARGRPRAFADRTKQNTIRAVDRATHVPVAPSELEEATLSRLAAATGDPAPSVRRVPITLPAHGIVELDRSDQTWHGGPGAFQVGSAFLRRTSLIERAGDQMRGLMEATGETANPGIHLDGEAVFVSQVEAHAPIRAFRPPGTRADLHASGIGKVHLAPMSRAPSRRAPAGSAAALYRPHALGPGCPGSGSRLDRGAR